MALSYDAVRDLIHMAIVEDLGPDKTDITTDSIFSNQHTIAKIMCKEMIVVCGVDLIRYVYNDIDSMLQVTILHKDGEICPEFTTIAEVKGSTAGILKGERIVLNFLQRMSGVATQTRTYVNALNNRRIGLLDTRKTIPGYRHLDKYAVFIGGGKNHRMGLYDMVMIKDNHKNAAGSLENALKKVQETTRGFRVEVEVENCDEAAIAAAEGCDVIMLDNMSNSEIVEASRRIRAINSEVKIEVSGGITLERLPSLGALDIDFISCGALTHSVRAVDISMEIDI